MLNSGNSLSETKSESSIEYIYGSFEHFINYYSFSKIRGKLRHPFYIGYHFNQTFQIFYNREYCSNEIEALVMIQKYKKQFNSKILLFLIKNGDSGEKNYIENENKFILQKISKNQIQQEMQQIQEEYIGQNQKQINKKSQCFIAQNLRKKLLKNLLISWDYFFVEIMLQQQTSVDNLSKKWVSIPKRKMRLNYLKYIKMLETTKVKLDDQEMSQAPQTSNNIFHQQVINLSRSIKQINGTKQNCQLKKHKDKRNPKQIEQIEEQT